MCWPMLGEGLERLATLPSQVKTCSSASRSSSSEASSPAEGRCRPQADASEASTVAASGGSAVRCTATRAVSSIERAMSRRICTSSSSHCGVIATTWPPASMPDASASITIGHCSWRRRLEERVDPLLAVEQPLRAQPEDQQRREPAARRAAARRPRRDRAPDRAHIHDSRSSGGRRRLSCMPSCGADAPEVGESDMEIVIALLVLVVGVGLLLGPRVARRRRSPAPAARSARWNGAAARGARGRAVQRSAAVATAPAAATYAPPADEDAWDDDLEWVDAPPEAGAPAAGAEPAAPAPEPAAPPAPAGRTWGTGSAPVADSPAADRPHTAAPLRPPRVRTPARHPGHRAAHAGPVRPRTTGRAGHRAGTRRPPRATRTTAPAAPLHTRPGAPASAGPAAPSAALGARPATPLRAAPAAFDDADAEWSTGVDVPPPRITRGAAAFGAASHPTRSPGPSAATSPAATRSCSSPSTRRPASRSWSSASR